MVRVDHEANVSENGKPNTQLRCLMNDVESVTIPMTKKDDKGNVMEYRVTPLAFDDSRFQMVRNNLGRELRTKFMKLYKKTKDAGAMTPAIEMSAFLAAFTFEQLIGWYGVLVEISDDPKMAALNTFHIFGETFKHLTSELAYYKDGDAHPDGVEDEEDDVGVDSEEVDAPEGTLPMPPEVDTEDTNGVGE